jgi:class 3 adenylate cyclase/tetratricopeptide (TPR) repeat protein/tRNA A-37 threonylcarbamoyl transferase component Bud32
MTVEHTPQQQTRVEEFQRRHQIRLLTLLFTDVVGSTRLKQLLGERAAIELTERHHALLREILAGFADAEEIGTSGDSFFMVFAKPSDAVHFALLAQRAVRDLARETGQPVLDRIGIHVGEVFIQDRGSEQRNLFGIQIDSAARIMSLGNDDQILLSRFAFDNARLVLRGFDMPGIGELNWLNHGYYELKGVEEPLEVCEVGEAGFAALTPPGDSEKAHRFHAADAEPVLGWRPAAGQFVPDTRWKLERPLGQGGFGEVWLAQHETLKQRRVLKFCFKAERARALKREATIFRVLRERFGEHPNIVAIHDVFFESAPFYLVTDYVDGPTLDRWSGSSSTLAGTPLDQRLELIAQVADALQAAHDSGIIHRDVKPSNVLIADPAGAAPRAKLVDFGIGQVINAEALAGVTKLGFTRTMLYTGSASGTPLYQAPELFAGQPATTRSDIYSLGVLLWQIVVGDFVRPLATDWAEQITDPLLVEDIRQCVAGDPAKRFAAAADLAARLRALPERRRALEKENAHRTEIERLAYRRGIVRTAGFAACIVAAIAVLALYAFRQAGMARAEKRRADEARENAEAAKQQAEAEKRRAVAAKEAADELINFMQYDLRDTLGKLGYSNMMVGINARIRKYYENHPADADDRHAQRERMGAINDQGTLLRTQGDLIGALRAFREGLAIAEKLFKEEPNTPIRQRDLSVSYELIGVVLTDQNDPEGALGAFQKCYALRETLLAKDPNNKDYQWVLARAHELLGDMLFSGGKLAEGLTHYETELQILRKLAAKPEPIVGIGARLELAGDSVKIVELVPGGSAERNGTLKAGDRITAVAQAGQNLVETRGMPLEKVIEMIRGARNSTVRLSIFRAGASDPATQTTVFDLKRAEIKLENTGTETPRDSSPAYNKIGKVFYAQGDRARALSTFQEGLAVVEKLVAEDPDNTQWRVSLAFSHQNIGDVLRGQGDLSAALQSYQASLAIREKLARQDPANTAWQRDLTYIYDNVGDVLKQQGQYAGVADQRRAALVAKVRVLGAEHPEILKRRMDLANAMFDDGKLAEAEAEHRDVLAIKERVLGPDHPDTLESQNDLANALYAQHEYAEAEKVQRAVLAARTRVLGEDDSETLRSRNNLAGTLTAQGNLAEALKQRRTIVTIREALAGKHPDSVQLQQDLAWSYDEVGGVLSSQGDLAGALQSYRNSLGIRETLAKRDPANADWQRNLSLGYNKVGGILSSQGDLGGALQSYHDGLTVIEKLAQKDPTNNVWQSDIAYGYNEVGKLLMIQQKWEEAANAFSRGLETARPCLDRSTSGWDWITTFTFAAGQRWTILRDAPAGTVKINHDDALRDVHTAREAMARLKEAGKLVPPMDTNLPWIDRLLDAADKSGAAVAQ